MRLIILCLLFISCNPQNRLNRKVKRAENYAYKHGLVIQDTVKVVDTVVKATGKDCGCAKRQQTLNRFFPYNN